MGKFHDDHDENQYFTEQAEVESNQDIAQIPVQIGVSKHAARRQKKKKAQLLVCDSDPTRTETDEQ